MNRAKLYKRILIHFSMDYRKITGLEIALKQNHSITGFTTPLQTRVIQINSNKLPIYSEAISFSEGLIRASEIYLGKNILHPTAISGESPKTLIEERLVDGYIFNAFCGYNQQIITQLTKTELRKSSKIKKVEINAVGSTLYDSLNELRRKLR